jgi:glucokinase
MTTLLAGDIGGTKTLLSLYGLEPDNQLNLIHSQRYRSADWSSLEPMLQAFLAGTADGAERPAAACFAVAGPVQHGRARLTNLPWQLEEKALAAATGIAALELVNDFAVLIYGLPQLGGDQQALIKPGRAEADQPLLVLGAGTGLGVAFGIPTPNGLVAVASEASHGEFAPRSTAEWELREWLRPDLKLERLSIERVVSGTGLGHVGRWMLTLRHPDGDHPLCVEASRWQAAGWVGSESADLPAALAAAAAAGDPLGRDVLDLWLGTYGSVAGDLALASLSRGGIWLAGGTAAKLLDGLRSPRFNQAFQAKGRLEPTLSAIPIKAIIDPAVGSFSAACRARMLLG